ncbi:MAG TPA: tetratricopeptide repeat protein [Pyrinomonadaceae bacterium]|nr:tetratricopeptide repeat protein [Pyrinomonadaceae bacterium]
MLDTKLIFNITGKSFFGISAILFCLALFSTEINAQTSLRNKIYGEEKTKTPTVRSVPKQKVVVVKKTSAPKKTIRQPVKTVETVKNQKMLNVTFTTREPKAEIWLDDKKLGVTDENRKLTKKIAAGDYKILAKTNRQVLFSTQMVSISADKTNIELIDKNQYKPKPVIVAAAPKIEQKSELEIAMEISAKVKEILESYADPKKTDSVTLEDWELVFKAAQLGQLQEFTAPQIEAHRWFASGQLELSKNEFTNAFTSFNKSLEFVPNSAMAFYGLGNTYFAKRQYQDAIKAYQLALKYNPKFAMAYRKIGDCYKALDKEKDAIVAYRNSILFGYDTTETHYLLGMTYLQDKQLEDAVFQLETVVKETPKAEIFVTIGETYEKLKRGVSAIENYHKAINLDPSSAVAYYKLGNAYYEQREYGKAKESLEKAIELDANGRVLNLVESQKRLREAASKINR